MATKRHAHGSFCHLYPILGVAIGAAGRFVNVVAPSNASRPAGWVIQTGRWKTREAARVSQGEIRHDRTGLKVFSG